MEGVFFVYVVVGSITTMARLARILEREAGIPASVAYTPSALGGGGCSYSVRIAERELRAAREIISEYGIRVKGIYIEEIRGGEREYHAIS